MFSKTTNHQCSSPEQSKSESQRSSAEEEARTTARYMWNWRHHQLTKLFRIVTDQNPTTLAFRFKQLGTIKNDNLQRWVVELSRGGFDIINPVGRNDELTNVLYCSFYSACTPLDSQKQFHTSYAIQVLSVYFIVLGLKDFHETCHSCWYSLHQMETTVLHTSYQESSRNPTALE